MVEGVCTDRQFVRGEVVRGVSCSTNRVKARFLEGHSRL
jgi:hypothetical protein